MPPLFSQTPPPSGVDLAAVLAVALPALLGLAAVFLLLPRPRPYPLWAGAALGLVALALLGVLLAPTTPAAATAVESTLFYLFSGVAIVAGVLLITQRNPARAALSFALVVLSTCGLFLLQAAPFLMAGTIIIYAGAIIVTFLFVLMLAQQEGRSDADHRSREPLLSAAAGFVLLAALLYVLRLTYGTEDIDPRLAHAEQVRAQLDDLSRRAAEAPPGQAPEVLREVSDAVKGVEDLRADYAAWAERRPVEPLTNALRALDGALVDVKEQQFRLRDRPQAQPRELAEALNNLHAAVAGLRDAGLYVRNTLGTVQADPRWPLSDMSGPPANLPPGEQRRDDLGRPELPAANVAYLGRSLFSDFLVPVELAGTLLLAATVGAIAIANRRAEGAATPGRNP